MQFVSDHTPLKPRSMPGWKKSATGHEVNEDYLVHTFFRKLAQKAWSLAIPVWTPGHKAQINNAVVTFPREHHDRNDNSRKSHIVRRQGLHQIQKSSLQNEFGLVSLSISHSWKEKYTKAHSFGKTQLFCWWDPITSTKTNSKELSNIFRGEGRMQEMNKRFPVPARMVWKRKVGTEIHMSSHPQMSGQTSYQQPLPCLLSMGPHHSFPLKHLVPSSFYSIYLFPLCFPFRSNTQD